MGIRIFLQQLRRGKRRTLLNILLLAAVTAFFVMSGNLYKNSMENLQRVEENYSTIALMELHGDVNRYGQLTDPEAADYEGYYSVGVKGYDFSEIVSADCVGGYDLRSRYAAYIPGVYARDEHTNFLTSTDHIRFRLLGDEPVELQIYPAGDIDHSTPLLHLEVLYSAAGIYEYTTKFRADITMREEDLQAYADDIRQLNGQDVTDRIILYPGVEYYMVNSSGSGWLRDPGTGKYVNRRGEQPFNPRDDNYGVDYYVSYFRGIETILSKEPEEGRRPFFIQKWAEMKNDPRRMDYFEKAEEALRYSLSSFCVMTTNDVMGVPAFHLGGANLYDGRFITREEYDTGAKVCMVSQQQASMQGWKVGDKLDMNFYVFDAFPNADMNVNTNRPIYHKNTEGFFSRGEYEIVGIYSQRDLEGTSAVSESALALPWITIYLPEQSLERPLTQEELPVHGNLLTIWLKNGTIDQFLSHIDNLGISQADTEGFRAQFTFYDQGYSIIQPSLQTMLGTSGMLLVLSVILLAVTSVLLAWFFAQSYRQSAGILRMLGGRRGQAVAGILVCALLVSVAGMAAGTGLGVLMTRIVGDRILAANLQTNGENADFRAWVLFDDGADTADVSAGIHGGLTLGAGLMSVLPFLLLVLCITALYIQKEPKALLPKGKA